MPRTRNTEREAKRLKPRNRKFIRKDTAEEYKSRSGMILVKDRDGTQTFFRPSDLASYRKEPKIEERPCHYCGKGTIRHGITVDGGQVPMCVGGGIEYDHTPKEPVIRFGERRA